MKNVKKFYDALVSDKGLQERAAALSEKYKGEQPNEDIVKAELLSFAKSEGYEFTADEFDAYSKQAQPVTDETAELVAGGAYELTCMCIVGGGGKDSDTGQVCACVIGGGGKKDNKGQYLNCIGYGLISS